MTWPWLSILVLSVALIAPRWFSGQGSFDSFYAPRQQSYLQKLSLAQIVKEAKVRASERDGDKACIKHSRVVVTLSTFEGRLGNLKMALESLIAQSCPPDTIYVHLSQNPYTKAAVKESAKRVGDGVTGDEAFWQVIRSLSSSIVVNEIEEDWGPATKLLAALQLEKDPNTWLITVDDDTKYHPDTVLSLTLAAMHLPWHVAPGFWCEEAWADGHRSLKKRTMEIGEEGSVHGWCGGFAGVLFKRFMFNDQVFNFADAPRGCRSHDDVWWGGHLLSAGNTPYQIDPGFFSVLWSPTESSERQAFSVNVLDGMATASGNDLQGQCASWFAALRGIHVYGRDAIPAGVYMHPELTAQAGQDLWILKSFFSGTAAKLPSGTFVEFGALDGRIHSKTNFFEAHMKWVGAMAEPSVHFSAEISQNRTLEELLEKADLQHVNYMTVNTEGSEHEVLSAFPFQPKFRVDVVQIEAHLKKCILSRHGWSRSDSWNYWCWQRDGADKLAQLMSSRGYSLAETFVVDVGGHSRSKMHHLWQPAHYANEMTVELIFTLNNDAL
eukprot:TRINITY_DN99466_c0_g1_i1.p1 TRINITY_DN99466_c0_g1~~TRINITY_DN99466_c0_g1_i1.p1  ORF type:complete len:552 (+),score=100.51 TRINITY_DN99466_c0_g1_i1:63-1718(+)